MPNLKRYSTTKATALALGIDSDDTEIIVTDGSTYPDPAAGGNGPYTILVGYGSDREEVCTVVAKTSPNSFTVLRAQDGSIATSKNIGDEVVHGVSKRDWNDMLDTTVGGTMAASLILAADPVVPLEAATKQYVDNSAPIGMIAPFNRQTAPDGWHLCDGSPHGSGELLAVSGSANTPDLRDKFVIAAGPSHAIGTTGGSATTTLSTANMPAHTHGGATASGNASHNHGSATATYNVNHYHSSGIRLGVGSLATGWEGSNEAPRLAPGGGYWSDPTAGNALGGDGQIHAHGISWDDAPHTHPINSEGSGTAFSNEPQYYALIYCVKKV